MKAKGTVWIAFGCILVLFAACLSGYNLWEAGRAKAASAAVVTAIKEQLPEPEKNKPEKAGDSVLTEQPDHLLFPDMEMPVAILDGQAYVGMLEIPVLELELPVMDEWSYSALKLAPCRYEGSAYADDLIVMAHNYEGHFGAIFNLQAGDLVLFTDMAGNTFSYQVIETELLAGSAVEDMSAGEWDLTLFTCNYNGQSRVTVRCRKIQ